MPKTTLNEADTRAKLIDPALHARGWQEDMIGREQLPGKVYLLDDRPIRRRKSADYVLKVAPPNGGAPIPVALVEAKDEGTNPGRGVEQVKRYAKLSKRHHIRFVFSTNGHRFIQHDRDLNFTSPPKPMAEFPMPEDLLQLLEIGRGLDFGADPAAPFATQYPKGSSSVRYYQDAAVRAVFEGLAKGQKRALLSMATGTGKTLVAVNILKRIEDAGQLRRALFVCDREALRDQARAALRDLFGDNVAEASSSDPQRNARVVVATYQLLNVDGREDDADDANTAAYITRHYGEDYFSHIIIDECHRSAWNKWSQVLTMNPNAVQVGLTATPRSFEYTEESEETKCDQSITADNLAYFGEPVYEYGIGPGMDDGYLAMMRVVTYDIRIGGQDETEQETGVTKSDLVLADVVDAISGEPATRGQLRDVYSATTLDDKLVMPDRCHAMCKALFDNLASDGEPEQKSIVFCVNVDHAQAVANTLNNLYVDWCSEHGKRPKPEFAFPCTSRIGSDYLIDFKGNNNRFFIATTVDLLTTGVDIPSTRNIVFFRYIKSPIQFRQMVGRGTRIDGATGKLAFTVHDFTNAIRLLGEDLTQRTTDATDNVKPSSPLPERTFEAYGVRVEARENGNFIVIDSGDGQPELVSQTEYTERIRDAARVLAPDLEALRDAWKEPSLRQGFVNRLPGGQDHAMAIRKLSGMEDVDLYDWLANVAYGEDALTREERARRFESANAEWLAQMPDGTRQTILALCSQFRLGGSDNLESKASMRAKEVSEAGGMRALNLYPNGGAEAAMRELKSRLFGTLDAPGTKRLD